MSPTHHPGFDVTLTGTTTQEAMRAAQTLLASAGYSVTRHEDTLSAVRGSRLATNLLGPLAGRYFHHHFRVEARPGPDGISPVLHVESLSATQTSFALDTLTHARNDTERLALRTKFDQEFTRLGRLLRS